MEQWPIVAAGEQIGRLEAEREGLYTRFRGEAEWNGGVLRLWVFGGGTAAALGVMIPDGTGRVRLDKKFSAGEMRGFPSPIQSAGPEQPIPQPRPAAPPESPEEDILWYSTPDGCLTTFDGRRNLIAFPAGDVRIPRGAEGMLRQIDGKNYIIFPE